LTSAWGAVKKRTLKDKIPRLFTQSFNSNGEFEPDGKAIMNAEQVRIRNEVVMVAR
jgi:hypothetical protein